MELWVVVIEDLRRAALDRVMFYAARRAEDAEEMARQFFRADGQRPEEYTFAAQRVVDVTGVDGRRYEVRLRRQRHA